MDEPNAVVETPIAEETSDVSQTESETTQETPVETNETPDQVNQDVKQEQPVRPNRAERRINQLTNKLKEAETPKSNDIFGQNMPPWWNQNQPLSDSEGNLTEEALVAKMDTVAKMAVAQERQRNDKLRQVESHSGELSEITKLPEFDNPKFDESFTDLYQAINYDANGQFVPKKSPREIYEKLKLGYSMGQSQGQTETSVKMAEAIANSAVGPSAKRAEDPGAKNKELYNKALSTGSTDDWAAYLKARG